MDIEGKKAYELLTEEFGEGRISLAITIVQKHGLEQTLSMIGNTYAVNGIHIEEEFVGILRKGLAYAFNNQTQFN